MPDSHPQSFQQRVAKRQPRAVILSDADCAMLTMICEANMMRSWHSAEYRAKGIGALAHDYFTQFFQRLGPQKTIGDEFDPALSEMVVDSCLQSPNETRFFMRDLKRIAERALEDHLHGHTQSLSR